jgi:hypothetical protein
MVTVNAPSERWTLELSPSYPTMPLSLAASSQTQIGWSPFSNFRQRLSHSIMGTKQLKVEKTDSGLPFFIQTRNRAGSSPSLMQEIGLCIHSPPGCACRNS